MPYYMYEGDLYFLSEIYENKDIGILKKLYHKKDDKKKSFECLSLKFIYNELHETFLWGY